MKNLNEIIEEKNKTIINQKLLIVRRDKKIKQHELKINHLCLEINNLCEDINDLNKKLEIETDLKNEIMQGFINVKKKLKDEIYLNSKIDIDNEVLCYNFVINA